MVIWLRPTCRILIEVFFLRMCRSGSCITIGYIVLEPYTTTTTSRHYYRMYSERMDGGLLIFDVTAIIRDRGFFMYMKIK